MLREVRNELSAYLLYVVQTETPREFVLWKQGSVKVRQHLNGGLEKFRFGFGHINPLVDIAVSDFSTIAQQYFSFQRYVLTIPVLVSASWNQMIFKSQYV